MKLPLSWLREFVRVPADAQIIAARLAGCGFEVAGIDNDVIDVEVTANRPDCLSVLGLAREVATALDVVVRPPEDHSPIHPLTHSPLSSAAVSASIDSAACGRYALAVADVQVGSSPPWIAERLTAAGIRPINNIVDVTNYVMLEMGQPMHAFDAAKLDGAQIHARAARAGEKLTTLDGQTRSLDASMLVIADKSRAIAVAGVMGGAATEVSASTTRIVLESAWFQPASVRVTARRLGLKTEASARFERGADIEAPPRGLRRALAVIEQIGAGRVVGAIVDVYPQPTHPRRLELRRARIERLLGDSVPDVQVERILRKLGFVATGNGNGWTVDVPAFRVDVLGEADLIEEVGRHWGFDRIPATFPALNSAPRVSSPTVLADRRVKDLLTSAGLQEAATFTFMERSAAAPFAPDPLALVEITNPLSEKFAVLRPTLLPGLLDSVIYNRRRGAASVRFFETGKVFDTSTEARHVAWILCGARDGHWSAPGTAVDFFDAKGIAELFADGFGIAIEAESGDVPWFTPGRAAWLMARTSASEQPVVVGIVGQIRHELASARGFGQTDAIVAGEIDLDALDKCAPAASTKLAPLPRHPSIVRDLSILVSDRIPAAALRATIRANAPETLAGIREFDRYDGKGVPAGQIGLSLRLTFRHQDRTLTDVEAQQAVDAIVAALSKEHSAQLRGA